MPSETIVCIGGGTGLYTLLSGLKVHRPAAQLAAVVSMMDSGGSTGRLRDDFGYLPPGDIRKCLLALSNAPHRLRLLMEYRFGSGEGLKGHSFGNLMLTALKDSLEGTPEEREYKAIEAMEDILNIRGKVYPVTLTNCHLVATLSDGSKIEGEANIDVPQHDANLKITGLDLKPHATLFSKTKRALIGADYIVIGPGDLYTSIMPNLLVDDMVETLKEAKDSGTKIIYVINAMTKHGETNEYTGKDFFDKIQSRLDGAKIDAVLINDGTITKEQKDAYEKENAQLVENNLDLTIPIITYKIQESGFARPSPEELGKRIGDAIERLT